jgi:hypothetical protein
VENQLSKLNKQGSLIEKWSGIISEKAQNELLKEAKTDERLDRILRKHVKLKTPRYKQSNPKVFEIKIHLNRKTGTLKS